jgi:hypothetical protein
LSFSTCFNRPQKRRPKLHSYADVHGRYRREHNFSISGLEGFDIRGKVIGIIGTGNIGKIAAEILKGFGPSKMIAYDAYPSDDCKYAHKQLFVAFLISCNRPWMPSKQNYRCLETTRIHISDKKNVLL